jgi:molybdopterin converting factor small subunit
VSSLLADGLVVGDDAELDAGSTLEVLPPFAGG